MTELHDRLAELLLIIWRGVPLDYKRRYMNIWEQFENNIRSAAYTSELGKFVNSLCLKMNNARAGVNAAERDRFARLLSELDARQTLKMLREETTLLVLMVRVANQERREKREAAQAVREKEEAAMMQPGFGLPEESRKEN